MKKIKQIGDIGADDIKEISRNVHVIRYLYDKDFKKRWLFVSDVHYDSVKCKRDLLKKHFDQALEENASIGIVGDWFDLMGGKYDPRSTYSDIRPEYKSADYMDAVVEDSIKFLTPYANNIVFVAHGNHETNYLKRTHTNPLKQLVNGLNRVANPVTPIILSGYAGWLVFKFSRNHSGRTSATRTKKFLYWHGQRSNAARSKGILQVDLDAIKFPDCDLIMKGDDHNKWYYPMSGRFVLNAAYKVEQTFQRQLRLGSYKDGLLDFYEGWEVEKGFQPLGYGGFWVEFYHYWKPKLNKAGHKSKEREIGIRVMDTNDYK